MMKDILIISNYYPPEKGAAANRIEQLALKLHQKKYSVTVVCPLANYPKGALFPEYTGKFSVVENRNNITVKRLWIYPSISKNLIIRIISVLSFSMSLFGYLLFKKTPHKVIVQSPPLLLSFISVFVLSLKRKKIILNVSDLWPLAALELKTLQPNSFSHKASLFMERFIYQKATFILGQSNEIITHVKTIITQKKCHLYRNFPVHEASGLAFKALPEEPIKIFYAGLLGMAQGVLELCEKIDLKGLNIELHLFGDGAERNQIAQLIASQQEHKLFFHGMIDRKALHKQLQSFDIAIVPLKTRIYGSVPSKIFEYGCLGFPILYFGGGEGETIVLENNLGWVVPVEDYIALNQQLVEISKMNKNDLALMKESIYAQCQRSFDLDLQINQLITAGVF